MAEEKEVGLYIKYRGDTPVAYIYGPAWMATAMFTGDIPGYSTAEEAEAAYRRMAGKPEADNDS